MRSALQIWGECTQAGPSGRLAKHTDRQNSRPIPQSAVYQPRRDSAEPERLPRELLCWSPVGARHGPLHRRVGRTKNNGCDLAGPGPPRTTCHGSSPMADWRQSARGISRSPPGPPGTKKFANLSAQQTDRVSACHFLTVEVFQTVYPANPCRSRCNSKSQPGQTSHCHPSHGFDRRERFRGPVRISPSWVASHDVNSTAPSTRWCPAGRSD